MEISTTIRQESVTDVKQGEPQAVELQTAVTSESKKYGRGTTYITSKFRRSDDGFMWSKSALPPNPSKDDTSRTFGPLHVMGIEEAVEYIEEHYGTVTNSYPTL